MEPQIKFGIFSMSIEEEKECLSAFLKAYLLETGKQQKDWVSELEVDKGSLNRTVKNRKGGAGPKVKRALIHYFDVSYGKILEDGKALSEGKLVDFAPYTKKANHAQPTTLLTPPYLNPEASRLGFSEEKFRGMVDNVISVCAHTREELEKLKAIMTLLPVAVTVISREMTIVYQNPKSRTLFSEGRDSSGLPCNAICPTKTCEEDSGECAVKEVFRTGQQKIVMRNTDMLPIHFAITPLINGGDIAEVLVTACDMREGVI